VQRLVTTLLVSEIFPPKTGGSGRWFWEIYRRLPRGEYVFAAGQDPRQDEFDRTHDLRVYRTPLAMQAWGLRSLSGLWGYARGLRHLRRLAKAEGVTVVHCGRCLPEGVMALALKWTRRIPYLCYVHGEDVSTATCSREHSFLVRHVLRGAEFLIANSRNTERLLLDEWHVPPERIAVLHPGVDTGYFRPAERDRAVRTRLGWNDRPVLLTVGRLQKRKGHDVLIRALVAIRRQVPGVLYAIAGDGEEAATLRGLVEEHGLGDHVQFLGEISDAALLHCYQQCDLFVLPNRQVGKDVEGFGMVLLEAQACGRPVLAGASGGTAETLRIPETGEVVPCDGPEELAALAATLLADSPRMARMGAAARQWIVERFDWASLSRQVEQLFRLGPAGATSPLPVESVRA
jgi:phosphatidylinositol alpha-1,6-mannosyltransferase